MDELRRKYKKKGRWRGREELTRERKPYWKKYVRREINNKRGQTKKEKGSFR